MRTLILVVACLAVVGMIGTAYCADSATEVMPTATTATMKAMGKVASVDAAKMEVVVEEAPAKTVTLIVNAQTLIKVDGKAAKIADLKKDMKVVAEYETEVSKKVAKSIDAKSAMAPVVIPAPVKK